MNSPIRTLLIEDNAAARAGLKQKLAAHPEVVVVGEADSVGRARTLFAMGDYDLVFLDIQLRGGMGFDLVPNIAVDARIIFVTAFDEYAIRAFEVNALDYLLKPVTPERLATALSRLGLPEKPSPNASPWQQDDLVHLRTDEGSKFVPVLSIKVIVSELNYTLVHLDTGRRQLVRRTLKEWEALLPTETFMRVSRETVICLQHVARLDRNDHRSGRVWIAGLPAPFEVSRRNWNELRARMQSK